MDNPNEGGQHDITRKVVGFSEAFWVWVKVALNSFGGPAGQIAVMHQILVEEKRWISEARFLHAMNYCMLLPGPEAQQLATYIGWLLHRTRGGLVAGILFILPGFISIMILSVLYAGFREVDFVEALFFGLKAAVLAVVVQAVVKIGRRALKNEVMLAIAVASFVAIFFLQVPFPFIVIGAGLLGFLGGRIRPDKFQVVQAHQVVENEAAGAEPLITDETAAGIRPSTSNTVKTAATWLTIWLLPLLVLLLLLGPANIFVREAAFFSTTAVVTFGGAYAVLAYIAQQAVEVYGWLRPGEMLDGLGMAETTPGPLIQVVQFVGFMGAYRQPEGLAPMTAGVLGALVTTWATFAPCFLWIFAGAPYIEHLRGNRALTNALSSITAAVVGVILNLAIWFAINTLFGVVSEERFGPLRLLAPEWATLDVAATAIGIGAFYSLFRLRVGMLPVLAMSAAVGAIYFSVWRGGV